MRLVAGAADLHNAVRRLFITHDIAGIGASRGGNLGVGVIEVVAGAVGEGRINGHIRLVVRRFKVDIDLKATGIREGLLLVVIPQEPPLGITVIAIDKQQGHCDGIEIGIVGDHDPVFDFGTDDLWHGHVTLLLACGGAFQHGAA
jgi:hypothetical protein